MPGPTEICKQLHLCVLHLYGILTPATATAPRRRSLPVPAGALSSVLSLDRFF